MFEVLLVANDRRSKVVRLLVDTGARRTVLSLRLLREFGCVNKGSCDCGRWSYSGSAH